ncbi:hypothetical protein KIN20_017513 [Parelaphostrongylus tenuis]|uniref:Uncharacterized protein n=1 Tax=Parelaphostrongylus tenuis TaxID=148309 RepID=A0AAD5MZZ1_PARTN|nr:hypothetical protein KIN20_017513 [Parelaphostrongylus tenuis]
MERHSQAILKIAKETCSTSILRCSKRRRLYELSARSAAISTVKKTSVKTDQQDPSTLDQAPVVEASQEFHGKGPVIVTRDMDQLNDIHNHNRTKLVNGKIVATIYPENTMCSWVIPPRYDPYTIPAVLTSECFSVGYGFCLLSFIIERS